MALVDLTKQLAQQAILSATEKADKPDKPEKPPEQLGSILLGQIQAMQKALKEDEELAIWFENGAEKIRVLEIYFPSWRLAVLTGHDNNRALSRIITPPESLQLIAKVMKVPPGNKPSRVGLVSPKNS